MQTEDGLDVVSACRLEDEDDDWGDDDNAGETLIELSIDIAPSMDIEETGTDCHAVVSIQAPDCVERAPADICCIVDISASMKNKATYENEHEEVVDDGLCYLDIVKHAVKSVMHMLREFDRFALVAYNDNAETVFPLLPMTTHQREVATAALDSLSPSLGTNIWAGITQGLEALQVPSPDAKNRQKTALLLTDGRDGHCHKDKGGHVALLRDYKEKHTGFNFQLNTFAFGYNLDSQLLLDLAMEGQGTFDFIPDALLVGTSFVNSVANVLSTQTQDATLHLIVHGGAQLKGPILGVPEQMVTDASWGRVVSLGPLQFGQFRDVVVPLYIPGGTSPYLESVVVWRSALGVERRSCLKTDTRKTSSMAIAALARSDAVDTGYQAIRDGCTAGVGANTGRQKVLALLERIARHEAASAVHDASVTALKADVSGRMSKALLGQDRFQRWGGHFLRSLVRSHQLQLCTNFMDAGLQVYGGTLFKDLRAQGDVIFLALPPPVPRHGSGSSKRENASTGRGRNRRRGRAHQPENMPAVAAPKAKAKAKVQAATAAVVAPNTQARGAPEPAMAVYYGGAGGG